MTEPVTTYIHVRDALHRYLQDVPGIKAVLSYEPQSAQVWPLIYSLLDEVPMNVTGQVETRDYAVIHRLCGPWQGAERMEAVLAELVDPVLDALRRAAWTRLDGLIPSGMVQLDTVRAGFLPIGGTLCRVVDFRTITKVKNAHSRHAPA